MDGSQPLDPRKTIFVGGVPRPLRAGKVHASSPPDAEAPTPPAQEAANADVLLEFGVLNTGNMGLVSCGGVPNPLRMHPRAVSSSAAELAMIMDRLYGGVCYAGIDTDPELKYPKGAGRVAFSNQQSYIAAISARFVQLQHNDIDKRVSGLPRSHLSRPVPSSSYFRRLAHH